MIVLPRIALAIDFGSTYTKVAAIDLDEEEVLGVSHSVSTVDKDMMIGLRDALRKFKVRGKGYPRPGKTRLPLI